MQQELKQLNTKTLETILNYASYFKGQFIINKEGRNKKKWRSLLLYKTNKVINKII